MDNISKNNNKEQSMINNPEITNNSEVKELRQLYNNFIFNSMKDSFDLNLIFPQI